MKTKIQKNKRLNDSTNKTNLFPKKLSKIEKILVNSVLRNNLSQAFIEKKKKNPNYSLRALSSKLDVDQSFLSKFLTGKKQFSENSLWNLGSQLGMTPHDFQKIIGNESAQGLNSDYSRLEDDQFHLISGWEHFAILEFLKISRYDSSDIIIAKELSLHKEEVRSALERLQRLGFIDKDKNFMSPQMKKTSSISLSQTTIARREHQRQLLEKSIYALEHVDLEDRFHGGVTVAINKSHLPEFRKRLAEMIETLGSEFQTPGELTDVYQLSLGFFPLNRIDKNESSQDIISFTKSKFEKKYKDLK